MCMYSQSVFSCRHKNWGLRIRLCKDASDFIAGKTNRDCNIRKPYPPTSRKLQCKCKKCGRVDAKIEKARKMIGNIRATMEEVERKDEEKRRREEEKGESVDHDRGDESSEEEEMKSEDEENGQDEERQEEREMGEQSDQESQLF